MVPLHYSHSGHQSCFFILPPCHRALIPKSKHLTLSLLDHNKQQLWFTLREDEGQTCRWVQGDFRRRRRSSWDRLWNVDFFLLLMRLFMRNAGQVNSKTQTQCVHVKNGAFARMTEAGGESGPDAWSVSVFAADSRSFCALSWLSLICFSFCAPVPFISSRQMRFCVYCILYRRCFEKRCTRSINIFTLCQHTPT